MEFKFERLEVWQLALEYLDFVYQIAGRLPKSEEYNLKAQILRAATSMSLDVAEGSTSQTDAEQGRFLGIAIRSAIETIACLRLTPRRGIWVYIPPRRFVRGEGSRACKGPASAGPSPRALPGGAGRRPSRTLPADCPSLHEVSLFYATDSIERRKYVTGTLMTDTCICGEKLFAKLQAFRKSLEGASDAGP